MTAEEYLEKRKRRVPSIQDWIEEEIKKAFEAGRYSVLGSQLRRIQTMG